MQNKSKNFLLLIIGAIAGWAIAESTKEKPFESLKSRLDRLKEKIKTSF